MRPLRFLSILGPVVALWAALCSASHAQNISLPSMEAVRGKQISIQAADKILRARAPKPRATALKSPKTTKGGKAARSAGRSFAAFTSIACSGTGQPVEIATLAASLKCDPDLIFEYVYNNIEYEPLYGSNKGALGTLLDLRGNDMDQAQLFVALLRAAGFSSGQTSFIYGNVRLTSAQASSWLGVKNDTSAIGQLLGSGGIPYSFGGGNFDIAQVWVRVNIGGTNYDFDPSYKQHTIKTGLSNLGAVLEYNQSQFLADAGGAIETVTVGGVNYNISISGMNRTAVRNDLVSYANNLIAYIKGNNPGWSVSDVIGGKTIQYLTGSPRRNTTLPIQSPSQPSGWPLNLGSSITNAYRTCFTITLPGKTKHDCASATSDNTLLYTDETYGHRITVFSTGGGCAPPSGSCTPTLLIDGAAPPNGPGSGTAGTYNGSPWTVSVSITHPYAGMTPTYSSDLKLAPGGSYLIGAGWGQVGRGMVEKHRMLLASAQAAGGSATSEAVMGESLAVISYSYLAQLAHQQILGDGTSQITTQFHHGVGIAGQTPIKPSGNQGPYVDLPMNLVSLTPQTYAGAGFSAATISAFYRIFGIGSSLESAVLEQTQGYVPGIQVASTVRLVDMNVATGAKTYFADGTIANGVTAYFTYIQGNLAGYTAADKNTINFAVSQTGSAGGAPTGKQVLMPINGNISVGTAPWTGAGFSITLGTSSSLSIQQLISGNLSGGFAGSNVPPTTVVSSTQSLTLPPSSTSSISSGSFARQSQPGNPTRADPVDTITGAYLYNHTDLLIGSGSFPYSLPFARNYSSAANTVDAGLGKGWRHNYDVTISRTSDPYAGSGEGSSINAAAAIAANFIMQDLLAGGLTVQKMTPAWVTARWLTDQLTNNAVQISWPTTTQQFIVLPHNDGSSTVTYSAPMGSAATVTGTVPDTYGNFTTFIYRNKDQTQLTFSALNSALVGQLASWTMPYGVNLSFTYGYSYSGNNYLSAITNNLGRTLTLAYSGSHISSVADGTGRSVSYGYDGNSNLISFRDPLNFQTTFAYDGAASHLTQIFYPSNSGNAFVTNGYDGLGRVSQQANANGNVTNFYLAGSRSEIVDPASNRSVTYQTVRGRVLKDVAVLSGSANVYYSTAQNNGVVNVTANQYDGLDRVTLVTAPEGGTTAYTYTLDFLNNVASITSTPKSGSPLSPLTTSYLYDPIYSKVTRVTDPRGLVSTSSYDSATGNLIATIADAGTGHFNATNSFTYNSVGQVLTATDPLGVVAKFAYDSLGNQTSITRDFGTGRLNQLTTLGFNGLGDIVSVTDPKGNVTTSAYDANRRLTSVTTPSAGSAPGGLITAYTYDPDGRVLQTQQSSAGTVLRTIGSTYTLTGEVATSVDAKGNVTKYGYDVVDRLASVTDPVSNTTSFGYDAMGRQISVTNAAIQGAPLLQKAYTPDGLLASLTDANSNATSFTYDGLDRLSVTTYPGSSSETLTYDADSNIVSRVTRKGDTISFAYDTLNRLCTKAIATSFTPCTTVSTNPTTYYAYDLAGRSIGVSSNDSASLAAPSGSGASYTTTATYDALNQPLTTSWTPTVTQATPTASSVTISHGYDANNRRITQASNDNSWWNYPNSAGTTSYTANTLNQYSAVGAVTPTYDGNGNLTSDGTYTYCYEAESRLTKILSSGTCASPTTTVASYAYDAQGRRKSKTVGGTTTVFVTDADNREVLEYDGSGVTQRWYAYGEGSNEVLNQMNVAASNRATMIPDIQGSIIGTLNSGGTLTKTGYRTYGENPTLASGTFNYTAQRLDAETAGSASQPSGLYYYRARMYSPTWGRFMQPDPIGYSAGMNLYAYVNNDPLNGTDPQGLCYPVCTVAGGAIIGGAVGGGYYIASNLISHNNLSWGGFLASTAEGAFVGGVVGSGAGAAAVIGAGAGSHATAQFITASADNGLGRYGTTPAQNAKVVLLDAAIGGAGSLVGKWADAAAPALSRTANNLAADVFLNTAARPAAAATFIRGIDPALQTIGNSAIGVGTNLGQDLAHGLYQYQGASGTHGLAK